MRFLVLIVCSLLLLGCAHRPSSRSLEEVVRMAEHSTAFGDGGVEVLMIAKEALAEAHSAGRNPDVQIEDLWAHAIKEGSILFNDPSRRWGKTSAEETADMIGQTTIGPWQITITNVKARFGRPYGVTPDMTDAQVYAFCRDHPEVQVWMIADLIQDNYDTYGVRAPYAIQRYFWLEAFVKGEIGQGAWDKSVLPKAPDGDWRKLTPEMKADTGMYGKQLVCGTKTQPYGLLYWLAVNGKKAEIRALLVAWRDQPRMKWDEADGDAVSTGEPGHFAIAVEDLRYLEQFPAEYKLVRRLVEEISK